MDATNFPEIISNMGFPIACCVALFWLINGTLKKQTEMMDDLKKAMEKNSETTNALIAVLGKEK